MRRTFRPILKYFDFTLTNDETVTVRAKSERDARKGYDVKTIDAVYLAPTVPETRQLFIIGDCRIMSSSYEQALVDYKKIKRAVSNR